MAPLKLSEEQVAAFNSRVDQTDTDNQDLELHPEAYKVKGPSPEKMKTVSSSLRQYANGLYGLL
ncbi:hypothetical protein [Pedobacter rhizosphaerae]|uniref:Uncharacterized protein n=1 Tax=Pedobacter rhizosphaerae TaxID=390241 RepID=A0A1H9NVF0_9SPHI|nr:hypothetical protein [Pedobacter rhizosphaerae]SER39888.1 hypothetical protein SAMN04488023_108141 [Pedobacter rhizosphaerae]